MMLDCKSFYLNFVEVKALTSCLSLDSEKWGLLSLMELELKDYIKILRKRMFHIIGLVVIAAVLTAVYSYGFMKPVYESSTALIVNNSQQATSNTVDINSVNLDIKLIDTYKQIIKTDIITDTVAKNKPELLLTGEDIQKMITVSSVNNTQMLTITAKSNDYANTVVVANEVAKVFVEKIPQIMTVNNVSILNEAKMVETPVPVEPNSILNIALSIVVALLLGIGLALLLEYMDDTIKDEHDVAQHLGLPVLISIPKVTESDLEIGKKKTTRTEVVQNVSISK